MAPSFHFTIQSLWENALLQEIMQRQEIHTHLIGCAQQTSERSEVNKKLKLEDSCETIKKTNRNTLKKELAQKCLPIYGIKQAILESVSQNFWKSKMSPPRYFMTKQARLLARRYWNWGSKNKKEKALGDIKTEILLYLDNTTGNGISIYSI